MCVCVCSSGDLHACQVQGRYTGMTSSANLRFSRVRNSLLPPSLALDLSSSKAFEFPYALLSGRRAKYFMIHGMREGIHVDAAAASAAAHAGVSPSLETMAARDILEDIGLLLFPLNK